MERRTFLLAALATLAAPLAFAGSARDRRRLLADAWSDAVSSSMPLLVVVVPDDRTARWQRSHALGAFLRFAEDDDLAPLARTRMVCAAYADLRALVPSLPAGEVPWLVLVRTDRPGAPARTIDVELREAKDSTPAYVDWFLEQNQRLESGQLQGTPEEVLGRDAYERAFPLAERPEVGALVGSFYVALDPVWTEESLDVPSDRIPVLAARARERFVLGAPLGGEWAWDSGCGVGREEVPGEEPEHYAGLCGMGHVRDHERRMLLFWDA